MTESTIGGKSPKNRMRSAQPADKCIATVQRRRIVADAWSVESRVNSLIQSRCKALFKGDSEGMSGGFTEGFIFIWAIFGARAIYVDRA